MFYSTPKICYYFLCNHLDYLINIKATCSQLCLQCGQVVKIAISKLTRVILLRPCQKALRQDSARQCISKQF